MEIQSTGRFSLVLAPVKSPLLADEMHQNLRATVRNACCSPLQSRPQTVDFEAAKEPAQATPKPPSAIPAV